MAENELATDLTRRAANRRNALPSSYYLVF